jgi:cell division protein FtsX
MSFWTVTLISLAIGLLLVIGGSLVVYMGSLVKNAYELKVEIQNDMEAGLKRIEEESEKKTRWIKRDLIEEIEKLKSSLSTDNQRKFGEMTEGLVKSVAELEQTHKRDRQEMIKVIDALRQDIMTLDQRLKSLKRDAQAPAAAPPADPTAPEAPQAEEAPAKPA